MNNILPIFSIKKLFLSFGDVPLFEDISFQVLLGDVICLIGQNGSGKSTLLKLVAGLIEPDKAEIFVKPGIKIGYLGQNLLEITDITVYDFVLQNLQVNPNDFEEHRYKADIILNNLQLDGSKKLDSLSGGQIRRADLARVLVTKPDLLLLDEPTNHLDIITIQWLEGFLTKTHAAVVLISHDRAFLNNITDKTIWLDRKKIHFNNKGYQDFEVWSQALLEQEARDLSKLSKELDKENLWLQQGVTARRKRNQQRLQNLYQLRGKLGDDVKRSKISNNKINIDIKNQTSKSKLLVEISQVSFAYKQDNIIQNFSLDILKGDKIGIMGKNGSGKTTLINLINGKISPVLGQIRVTNQTKISFLDQFRTSLDPNKTLWETLCPGGGDTIFLKNSSKHVVAYLKDFLFDASQALAKVATLSGGQRNRLLLAKLLINPGNLMILDEPTNDLDIDTIDMLVEILSDYDGGLLISSHDRDFLDRIVTKTLMVETPNIFEIIGSYYNWQKDSATKKLVKVPTKIDQLKLKSIGKLSFKEQYELDNLPGKIADLSAELKILEKQINDLSLGDFEQNKFASLLEKFNSQKIMLENFENRWLELEEKKLR